MCTLTMKAKKSFLILKKNNKNFQKPLNCQGVLCYNKDNEREVIKMLNIFKRNKKEIKTYKVTYIDGDETFTEIVNSNGYSNFMMGLDMCGCEVLEVEEI